MEEEVEGGVGGGRGEKRGKNRLSRDRQSFTLKEEL